MLAFNSFIFSRASALCKQSCIISSNICLGFQDNTKRYSSYRSSRDWEPESKVNYVVSQDPEEWKYVTRLLPQKYIPEPSAKDTYSSGWWPQNSELLKNEPYIVRRSKNHMIPVYLKIANRGLQKTTVIRHIKGDIWAFEQDLKQYLANKLNRKLIGCRVDEVACKISLRGDFVHYVSEWFLQKGL